MGIFELNPAAWYESAITAGLERDGAISFLNAGLSATLTLLAGLASLPLIGKTLLNVAFAIKISFEDSKLFEDHKLKITYPNVLDNADIESKFVTIYKGVTK